MKNNIFKDYIAPVVVLTLICVAVTFALAFIHGVTEPVIESRSKSDSERAMRKLIKDASGFKEYKGELLSSEDEQEEVTAVNISDNNKGSVVTVDTKSFGGTLTMMVGIDDNGEITGIVINSHSDTPGVGTKDMTAEYLGQYRKLTEIHDTNIKKDDQVDYISGASITGEAIHLGVDLALKQNEKIQGAPGKKEGEA